MKLKEKIKIIPRKKFVDERGWFLKAIDGKEDNLPDYTGEIYLTSAVKGQVRGNHYHNKATEWFTLIDGKCTLYLEDIETKEKMKINLDADNPFTIVIPPKVAHAFVNFEDKPFILLAYTDLLYDPEDTIRYELYTNERE